MKLLKEYSIWNGCYVFTSVIMFVCFILSTNTAAGQMTHTFKSPVFSGHGYSAHVMTIENQEFSRKKAIKDKEAADARQAVRDEGNTNLSKFMKNVESRIYAQLSKQLVDSMFGEKSETSGTVTFEGTTISYVKDSEEVALTIVDPNGSTTVITVPIGDFTF
mgnify:FL=1